MRHLLNHIRTMFSTAQREGMVICMAKPTVLPLQAQSASLEGSLVTQLRVLCGEEFLKIGEHRLRNDWTESLRRGIDLCLKNDHQGDADTLREILQYLEN